MCRHPGMRRLTDRMLKTLMMDQSRPRMRVSLPSSTSCRARARGGGGGGTRRWRRAEWGPEVLIGHRRQRQAGAAEAAGAAAGRSGR